MIPVASCRVTRAGRGVVVCQIRDNTGEGTHDLVRLGGQNGDHGGMKTQESKLCCLIDEQRGATKRTQQVGAGGNYGIIPSSAVGGRLLWAGSSFHPL